MTFGRLKDAVARLGFERELEDEGVLMPALSVALYTIFTDRPQECTKRIIVPPFSGRLLSPCTEHKGGKTEKIPLFGRAVSAVLSGKGICTLRSSLGTDMREFNSPYFPLRARIGEGAELELSGDYDFSVISLTVYESLRSESISELPLYENRCEFKPGRLIPDLLALSRPITDANGEPIPGIDQTKDTVRLPEGYAGEITVSYYRAPTLPSGLDADEQIDVPAECSELLPLLVASYVWLEDSPDTAQYYLSLYRDGMATLGRRMPRRGTAKYETNGWA